MKPDITWIARGWLRVELSGSRPERMLNLAAQAGINLDQVRRQDGGLTAALAVADLPALARLAGDQRCTLRVIERHGAPFIASRARRRPLLPLAALLAALLLFWLSSLVMEITVTAGNPLSEEEEQQVLVLAAEAGLHQLCSRWLVDEEAVEEHILAQLPQLFYVEIFNHGSRVEIATVRRIDVPEELAHKPPGDLLASAPGVVRDVLVNRGTAAVKPGQTVKAGDVLICGWANGAAIAADGIVTLTVYAEGYGECAERAMELHESGQSAYGVSLRGAGGGRVNLLGAAASPYDESLDLHSSHQAALWRKIPLSVEIIFSEFRQLLPVEVQRSPAEAEAEALAYARKAAFEQLLLQLPGAELYRAELSVEHIDLGDQVRRCRVVASCLGEPVQYCDLTPEQEAAYAANPPLSALIEPEQW